MLHSITRRLVAGAAVAAVAVAAHGCSSDTRDKRQAAQAAAAATAKGDTKKKPRLDEASPASGDLAGGEQVVLKGKRFQREGAGTTRVVFGGVALTVTPVSDDELWVVAPPAAAAGPVDIVVVNDHGSDTLAGGYVYELAKKTKPKLDGVAPARGPLTGGTPVVLSGKRFLAADAGETVVLFGTERVVATPRAADRLEVLAPPGARPGRVTVRVVNAHGMDDLPDAFEYEPAGPDTVRFSPGVGRQEGGTRVTVTTSFALGAAPAVTFDGVAAAAVAAVDSHAVVVEVPAGLRPGRVRVSVSDGGRSADQDGFVVQGALVYGDLLVNEVLADASQLDANGDGVVHPDGDEFVELVNTRGGPLDLTGLELLDGSGEVRHRFPNPTTLPAGGALVVFGGGTPVGFAGPHASGHAQCATSGKLGLGDGGDRVEVRTPAGRVLFRFEYDGARADSSWNRKDDGQRLDVDPAVRADEYRRHTRMDGVTAPLSPGRRAGGAPF
ncbi:MAG: IPT/TIG domain-containing protein [Planctomycetes bacterium]|nr:IPT/TIG domain-containing protein [Planctomycetota bacterium]